MTIYQCLTIVFAISLVANIYAAGQFIIGKWSIPKDKDAFYLVLWNIAATGYLTWFFNE